MKHPDLFSFYRDKISGSLVFSGVEPPLFPFIYFTTRSPASTDLLVLPDKNQADRVVNDLVSFLGDPSMVSFVGNDVIDGFDVGRSSRALRDLVSGEPGVYVTTVNELLCGLSPHAFERFDMVVGGEYSFGELEERLLAFGFERDSFVVEPGVFSVRGGVVDFFPGEADYPIRLDFLGNTLDSAFQFDPASQRSVSPLEKISVFSQKPFSRSDDNTLLEGLPESVSCFLYSPEIKTDVFDRVFSRLKVSFRNSLSVSYQDQHDGAYSFDVETQPNFQRNLDAFRARLSFLNEGGYRVFLCSDSSLQLERLDLLFGGFSFSPLVLSLSSGFIDHSNKLAVLTDHQIFGRSRKRSVIPRYFPTKPVTTIEAFNEGDIVVHLDYGIGRYLGVQLISVPWGLREALAIEYEAGDRVYVPVEKMNRVHKYESSADTPPKLTRLRTTEWEQIKFRTKKSIDNYARELMELYASRYAAEGFRFSPDTDIQLRLEASFLYTETSDQLIAIEEIKKDMESLRPMDRLLCGDVGFGKTEVAMRAAFKAVSDSKQVGVLVPTTILAQQHFETFSERFLDYPVTVDVLSRFRSSRQISASLKRLAEGHTDILIGTHRMLSKDVCFKQLGLLIVDEEHRFGVKHKERIKEIKTNVDSLSMTATPIPRTLQMSLMGAREISLLKTPPRERIPIETVVAEFSDNLIREAVLREVDRGGQVFFVHNRVESIGILLQRLQSLLPEIRIGIGHGQMHSRDLERVMLGFFHHDFDVLLSTTIIESGLDIPNANTIIVNRADAMGLSQLYQLRGRVGRSNRKAWAYFLSPGFRNLSPGAIKRLNSLKRHAHYGGGYELAMRDLEIRGSGNIFGTEQSGHLVSVGYHLYSKILQDTLLRLKETREGILPEFPKTDVSLDVEAQIPRDFVPDAAERVAAYRRLAQATTTEEVVELQAELRERFGQIPEPALNLFTSALISLYGQGLGLRSLIQKGNHIQGDFHRNHVEQAGPSIIKSLSIAIEKSGIETQIMNTKSLTFILTHRGPEPPLDSIRIFLESMM